MSVVLRFLGVGLEKAVGSCRREQMIVGQPRNQVGRMETGPRVVTLGWEYAYGTYVGCNYVCAIYTIYSMIVCAARISLDVSFQ